MTRLNTDLPKGDSIPNRVESILSDSVKPRPIHTYYTLYISIFIIIIRKYTYLLRETTFWSFRIFSQLLGGKCYQKVSNRREFYE